MKRAFSLLLTLALLLSVAGTGVRAAESPRMVIASTAAAAGDTVTLEVALENNPGINTFTLSVVYDKTRLVLDSVDAAAVLGGTFIYTARTETLGWQTGRDITVTGTVLYLHFTVLEDAPTGDANVTITYKPGNVCNFDEEDVDFEIVGGKVTVEEKKCPHSNLTAVEAKTATCLEAGNAAYYVCDDCGTVLKADGVTETTAEAETVAALGHDLTQHKGQAPTCTESGWSSYVTCSRCDHSTYQEIAATGHDYAEEVTAPTCTEGGYTTHTCACGDTYVDSHTAPLGHSYTDSVTAPTCTEQGYTTHTCATCGHSHVDSYVEAVGHHYENGVCTVCGREELSILPGDVNDDGEIDLLDANLVAAYYHELRDFDADQLLAADVNGDGEVDLLDANLIAAYYHELLEKFPIE